MSVNPADAGHWIAVCAQDRLAQQAIVCARASGLDVLIIRDGTRIFATERACPHEQADLSLGRVADGRLFCPRHLAWFSMHGGDTSPGWPSRPLRRYPVRLADGQVWIQM